MMAFYTSRSELNESQIRDYLHIQQFKHANGILPAAKLAIDVNKCIEGHHVCTAALHLRRRKQSESFDLAGTDIKVCLQRSIHIQGTACMRLLTLVVQ